MMFRLQKVALRCENKENKGRLLIHTGWSYVYRYDDDIEVIAVHTYICKCVDVELLGDNEQ